MTELIDSIRVEPFQFELTVAALVVSAVALVCSLIYGAWKTTTRRPLEFDLFLVEMHTMERRRLVEVLHIGPNYERGLGYTCLISRLRSRANQSAPEDGQFLGISDTNIVIHSPSTVNEPNAQANVVVAERNQLILWDIEMPRSGRTLLNPARDSHVASAAAITVLARPAVRNTTSREGQTAERGSNSVASSSTLVRMQYMPPLRRRPLVHILNYRMPVAVTLARESSQRVLVPQQRQRSTSTPSTHSPPDFDTPRESEQAPSENPAPEMSTSIPPLPTGRGIQIRLKFLDDTQKLVDTDLAATVLQFKHSTFPLEMSQSKVIRLIFRGKLMRDDSLTLEAYGVQDGAVVHCHISSTPYAQAPSSQNAPNQRREQPRAGEHSAEVDRSNVWFFRVILAFLTTQLTSLPVQFRARFQELLARHEARLRPSERDNVLSNGYRRWYNYFIVPLLEPESPLDAAAAAAANPNRPLCIGNFLFWIFGFQCFVVWMFVSYFPQLCDRTALGLLCLLTLYFFFVVVPMPSRRQPQTTQNQ